GRTSVAARLTSSDLDAQGSRPACTEACFRWAASQKGFALPLPSGSHSSSLRSQLSARVESMRCDFSRNLTFVKPLAIHGEHSWFVCPPKTTGQANQPFMSQETATILA